MNNFPSNKELEQITKKLSKGIASRPLPKDADNIDRIKYRLCERFVIYLNGQGVTQKALAKTIGIDEALMSKILHYHYKEFSVDRLIKYLSVIYPDIDLDISVA